MKIIPDKSVFRYRYHLEMWKLAKLQRWAAQHPIISRWYKMDLDASTEENEAFIIPIQQAIQGDESTVLPYQVLEPLIREAAGHMLLDRCPCRNGVMDFLRRQTDSCLIGPGMTTKGGLINTSTNSLDWQSLPDPGGWLFTWDNDQLTITADHTEFQE